MCAAPRGAKKAKGTDATDAGGSAASKSAEVVLVVLGGRRLAVRPPPIKFAKTPKQQSEFPVAIKVDGSVSFPI